MGNFTAWSRLDVAAELMNALHPDLGARTRLDMTVAKVQENDDFALDVESDGHDHSGSPFTRLVFEALALRGDADMARYQKLNNETDEEDHDVEEAEWVEATYLATIGALHSMYDFC